MDYQSIIEFWFVELKPAQWWKKDHEFDCKIKERFESIYQDAARGKLTHWRVEPQGRLAEIIALDQFPRNMYRDTPEAFASDELAVKRTLEAIELNATQHLDGPYLAFLLMPLMHSELLSMQRLSVKWFTKPGLEANRNFAIAHHDIIERFGRFPHRNAILGRHSTQEELEFLQQPGSSF
jgi:uncharacterized protein (DUF924 family)